MLLAKRRQTRNRLLTTSTVVFGKWTLLQSCTLTRNCLQPRNLDLICSSSTICCTDTTNPASICHRQFSFGWSGDRLMPGWSCHHSIGLWFGRVFMPDLRREDIWLCLGARSFHLSIYCSPPFRHGHAPLSSDLVACSCCSLDLRREDIWLCLGARSFHLSIYCSPPFRHGHASLPSDLVACSCCLHDLRCEDIRLCLGAGCHLSFIVHHLLHVHTLLSIRLTKSRIPAACLTFDARIFVSVSGPAVI